VNIGFYRKLTLGAAAALAAISLGPGSAQAFVVSVGGVQYDVSTFTATRAGNATKFQTEARGGVMPWWFDRALAEQFATEVGTSLGMPNSGPCLGLCGPLFAYGNGRFSGTGLGATFVQVVGADGAVRVSAVTFTSSRTWAQATLYSPASAPGPLPVFGVAAAFGFSRKLKKRIKASTNAVTNTYNL
jgi:hypothetical protein